MLQYVPESTFDYVIAIGTLCPSIRSNYAMLRSTTEYRMGIATAHRPRFQEAPNTLDTLYVMGSSHPLWKSPSASH